ncbi:MAG: ATP-dependent RecD-like DNA helicase [Pirellulaceae bacterium]|jgi:exodeoxyribonuclease V alpha subunit|nr:ATP-dependent RecD-like DNA helicase [Pirellulaceae bacterium]
MTETLNGIVERVTYHNVENGFAVVRVKVTGRNDLVTVVGNATSVTAGEHCEATGHWTIDRQHGQQFKASELRITHPASAEGIERYLASGAIRGLGPKLAARIVDVHHEQTLEILEDSPDFLLHIKGIGPERVKRIRQSWQEQKEVRKIMLFLTEHCITAGRAVRIYRTYGHESIAKIKANPYQLADDIRGIGFKTADELAAKLGIDRNSPYRARAAVLYSLQELASKGHCGYPEPGVVEHTTQLVEIEQRIVEDAVVSVVADGDVVRESVDGQPWLFLLSLHRAEVGLAQFVHHLASATPHPLPSIDFDKAVSWVERQLGINLAAGQQEAIRQACQHKLLVITGGPGVGKTTLVRSILEIFSAKKLKCVLAAPTGRATKRLAETTERTAKTIHRLLEFDPATGDFKRNQHRPLAGDLFVLDETSMVDVVLGHQFLRAVPSTACVILVGDADQLPSVGPGAVLADLIASNVVPVVRLTEIFRQARQSRIITAAYAVNHGQMPDMSSSAELTDFYVVESNEPEAIQEMVVKLVKDRIPDRFGLDPKADIQVLTPMNRSLLGARNLNQVMQEAINPGDKGPEVQRFGWTFRIGDRVIQTENNYNRDVFNGDLGLVEKINRVEQLMTVNFEGCPVEYDFADLDELSLAYVLSIHKSQGSEFPCVVIPLHTQHYLMLKRNLLYTAVTRGKQLVILVGTKKAIGMAVHREDTGQRCTALKKRLQDWAIETSSRG